MQPHCSLKHTYSTVLYAPVLCVVSSADIQDIPKPTDSSPDICALFYNVKRFKPLICEGSFKLGCCLGPEADAAASVWPAAVLAIGH